MTLDLTESSPDTGTTTALRGHTVPTGLYIDGAWIARERRLEVTDPSDVAVLTSVSDGGVDDAVAALDAAARAQAAWGRLNPRSRAELLRRAHALMLERRDAFVDLMVLESGKPRAEAVGEFGLSAGFLLWAGEQVAHVHGAFGAGSSDGYRVVTTHQPVGPSLLITPWNFPLLMGARKMSAALAAGCTVVVKSADLTPLTIALLVATLADAGIPAGVVNLIHTSESPAVSAALMTDRRLKKVSFTGSTRTGSVLLRQAADNIMSTSLELGGNGPFIVLDDADVDHAVEQAIACKFRNAGQACVAANRIIVDAKVAEEFTRKFVAAAKELRVGNGFEDIEVGPIISRAQRDRAAGLVATALEEGATLLTGGHAIDGPGNFFEPTVLTHTDRASRLAVEEIFAPIAVIYTAESIADAIEFANDTDYGLAAYLFTKDLSRAVGIAERLDSGMVGVNRGIMADPVAPFGGVKASGLRREGGDTGIDEFLEQKYIALTIDESELP